MTGRDVAGFDAAAFAEVVDRVRATSVERDRERLLPRDEIRALQALGLGRARVPVDAGGEGASLETLFARLIDLAAADANVAHVFRGHLALVEQQWFEPDAERRATWYERAVAGDFIGNAQSELSGTSDLATTLEEDADGVLRLTGRKFYTTGSIFADWIDTSARFAGADHQVVVSTHVDGVDRVDDWKGFGQRVTGSGTTVFAVARVERADVRAYAADHDGCKHPYLMGFYQLVLLSVVAGIARAATDDAVAFVLPRSRIVGYAGQALPREDALVQSVVGELSSVAFAARASVLEAARGLDRALDGLSAGSPDPAAFAAAQLDVYRAQQVVLPQVIHATQQLFEVGGASAVDSARALDRHWRNARTIASHNPAVQRRAAIGRFELTGQPPEWSTRHGDAPQHAGAPGSSAAVPR